MSFIVLSAATLTFHWSAATVVLAVAAGMGTCVLCFLAWKRSGYRSSVGMLEILRLALVLLVALTLAQPEWLQPFAPEQHPP